MEHVVTSGGKKPFVLTGKTVRNAVFIAAIAGFVLAQFRLLSLFIIVVITLICLCFPGSRRKRFLIPAATVVAIAMFLPFDVALGGWHYGMRVGRSSGGPHLVRFSYGFTSDAALIGAYGECITTGCCPPCMFPPKWILVWN
jgi:hypothetical protein